MLPRVVREILRSTCTCYFDSFLGGYSNKNHRVDFYRSEIH